MAEVTLRIGDRMHRVACRDGEEAQLERLGARLDRHYPAASRGAGNAGGERIMLLIALMLADELSEAERRPASEMDEVLLGRIAERLESVATSLEKPAESA
ncbi:MAG TPA: cell division protein ZapA [Sphingomicrobium sp.]|jgi:cell division protein ZapA